MEFIPLEEKKRRLRDLLSAIALAVGDSENAEKLSLYSILVEIEHLRTAGEPYLNLYYRKAGDKAIGFYVEEILKEGLTEPSQNEPSQRALSIVAQVFDRFKGKSDEELWEYVRSFPVFKRTKEGKVIFAVDFCFETDEEYELYLKEEEDRKGVQKLDEETKELIKGILKIVGIER